jgi:hypothetical protein
LVEILLVKPKCRWEDNVKMDFGGNEQGVMDHIQFAQDRDKW